MKEKRSCAGKYKKQLKALVLSGVILAVLAVYAGCSGQKAPMIMTIEPENMGVDGAEAGGTMSGAAGDASGSLPGAGAGASGSGESGIDASGSGESGIDASEAYQSSYSIVYTGDVCLQSGVTNTYATLGVNGVIGEKLLGDLTGADYTVINHEFCFSTGGVQQDKTYTFRADPKYVTLLNEMGVDLASLANNHALDYGTEALSDTFVTLDNAEISYMGAGETVDRAAEMITVEVNGYTIGYMAASRVYPTVQWNVLNRQPGMLPAYDPEYLAGVVKEKAAQCDYLMIYLHWGVERMEHPEAYERELAKKLIDNGADAVIGSHPHVLQGVEYYSGKPIFYSLGNFVFNAGISRTAFLRAEIDFDAAMAEKENELADYVTWQMIPCKADKYCTEEVTDQAAKDTFYSYMQGISYDVSFDRENGVLSEAIRE